MKALITGGAGYIGSTVSNYLLDKGHEVTIIDNLSTGSIKNIPKKAHFYRLDISEIKKIKKILLTKKINIVFHFAASTNNEESLKNPKKYYLNNFTKGKIFFESCLENKIYRFIYSSTAAVYGNKNLNVTETDKLNPASPYSKSKLKLENFLRKKRDQISCIILRYFNVAGVDSKMRSGFNVIKGSNLILKLCAASLKKDIFLINGSDYKTRDGTPIRDYIHVEDLAQIHLSASHLILKKKLFKILNCGYGKGFTVMEILKEFNLLSKQKIKFKIGKRRPRDIMISIANPKKLIKSIKWKPKFNNLTTIVSSSLNWYKKQWKIK